MFKLSLIKELIVDRVEYFRGMLCGFKMLMTKCKGNVDDLIII